jgi:flagellar basal body-associated protein FliL
MAKKKTDGDAAKKNSKSKLIVVVVALALVGYKFFLAPQPAPAKVVDAPPKEGVVVSLPDLTLNLADDSTPSRYLRVGVALVLEAGVTAESMKEELAKASDVAVTELSRYHYAELHDVAKREQAKADLSKKVREAYDNTKVVRVIFTSFVMQ